ncbi:unnamed protein product [Caenorhabditis angaria]|uniref:Uncharacterized protein n=1 Tax=Caenorhabditis angaria TaxID=860376 RepID=A0A9P1IEX0_9PELO|nr:unnamed protein product [Caenorhabditis angaria]
MVFRIFRQLFNNEKTIQQLSESLPIRTTAKAIVRGLKIAEEKAENLELGRKITKFKANFDEEYQKALKK